MCSSSQIVKVLTLYTPVIEFEERVTTTFIATIKVSCCDPNVCKSVVLFYGPQIINLFIFGPL